MTHLRLTYFAHEETEGTLWVEVESDEFRGTGSAWVDIGQIREFHERLGDFPISNSNRPTIKAGASWMEDKSPIQISLCPNNGAGAIRTEVRLATEAMSTEEHSRRHEVRTWFVVTYADVTVFQNQVAAMMEAKVGSRIESVLQPSGS